MSPPRKRASTVAPDPKKQPLINTLFDELHRLTDELDDALDEVARDLNGTKGLVRFVRVNDENAPLPHRSWLRRLLPSLYTPTPTRQIAALPVCQETVNSTRSITILVDLERSHRLYAQHTLAASLLTQDDIAFCTESELQSMINQVKDCYQALSLDTV